MRIITCEDKINNWPVREFMSIHVNGPQKWKVSSLRTVVVLRAAGPVSHQRACKRQNWEGAEWTHSRRVTSGARLIGFAYWLSPFLSPERWGIYLSTFPGGGSKQVGIVPPATECKLTFLSYFGSPFSSWLPLPDCSHHGGRFQRSPSEGQRADGIRCGPSGTSNSHSRLSRVSMRFQNKQLDRKEYHGPLTTSGMSPCHIVDILWIFVH